MAARGDAGGPPAAAGEASVVVVTTADALVAAVSFGARDIEIRSHLDLTSLRRTQSPGEREPLDLFTDYNTHLMFVSNTTRSIRGNCSDPGAAASLISTAPDLLPPPLPIKAAQCVVVIGDSLMRFLGGTQWLDNVYFRIQRSNVNVLFVALDIASNGIRDDEDQLNEVAQVTLYMTNVTVQGQRRGAAQVLMAQKGSKILAQDCIFSDIYGGSYPFRLKFEASLNFIRSRFQNIGVSTGLLEISSGGIGRFENSTFQNIHTPNNMWVTTDADDVMVDYPGPPGVSIPTSLLLLQRDVVRTVMRRDPPGGTDDRTHCSEVYIAEEDVLYDNMYGFFEYYDYISDSSILPAAPFAFPEDAWLVGARQDLRQPNQSGPPTSLPLPDLPPSSLLSLCESDKANSSRSETHLWPAMSSVSNRSAALVGVTQDGPRVDAALALLLPALIAAVLLTAAAAVLIGFNPTMQHRPRNSTSSEKDEGKRSSPALTDTGTAKAQPMPADADAASEQTQPPSHPSAEVHTDGGSSAWTTLPTPPQAAPQRPGVGATESEWLAYIGKQLDAFGRRAVVLKQFEMLGGEDRCIGGQAVVQFVRAPRNNHLYAIKLFASRAAYDDEKHLYVNFFPGFMPTVVQFVDNDDGSFKDPFGSPMPPCFVMEKGESLTERTMRRESDIFTTVQIIGQVASCLAQLHGQGWVHRDLKPGNIMYLPRTASWTLIDFGLAARIGENARLGYTLAYAAPEVIVAAENGLNSVTADMAVDAWALGVMAFELLTGRPMYRPLTDSSDDLERQLLGEELLPWEGDRLTADTKRRLGAFRAPVLRMLSRDPAQRASCKELAAALRAVFSSATTANGVEGSVQTSAV